MLDFKSMVEVAAGLAGFVSTSLEIQRRISDYRLNARGDRLRARAEELAKFLQIQMQLHNGGADENLTQQAISSTKAELDKVLKDLVRVQQAAGAIKIDEMSPLRQWLLLFVPARRFAWVLHFGFYFTGSLAVLTLFQFKAVSQLVSVTTTVVVICVYTATAVLLRYWDVMEKRWAEGFRPNPSPKCRGLLWYRPASRREIIARAGLLFGLFQFSPWLFRSGPFVLTPWVSHFWEVLTVAQLFVTLVIFYAWSMAELSLATNPVEMKFPSNLRFLRWPQNRMTWFWMICFPFTAANAIYFMKKMATVNIHLAAIYQKAFRTGGMITFALAYLLPMYALNRILLAQSKQRMVAPLTR